ncbi:translocon-associated protein subunit delta-like [Corticium candelabrum]|uniref:translocon-associated protein subunit delta-like n=1 Tax=Corticium candelabrum TaxID=121492 RepID=UPI002E26298C|nr:translocon-associated protein subunit delta-like [Corticium candelabrum]
MAFLIPCLIVATLLPVFGYGETCSSPQATFSTYSTTEILMASETVFIAEFELTCGGQPGKGLYLHAEISGLHVPVTSTPDTNKYQVSWHMKHSVAKAGVYTVNIYDEEGYAALRKAQRSGEATDSVKPMISTAIKHKGASRPGFIVQTEFVAVLTAFLVWWYANSVKGRISE